MEHRESLLMRSSENISRMLSLMELHEENIQEPTKGSWAQTAPDFVDNDDKSAGPRESDVKRTRKLDQGYGDHPNGEALRVVDKVRNNAVISGDMVSKMKERRLKEYL